MNAPENCGRAPPQACAGDAFGPQAKPSPAGDGFSGLRPLAPAAPGRPAARPSPCGNSAFMPNTFRIIRSNLYSFRRIFRPLPFGRSASFAKARIHRAKSVQKAARPLLHRLCAWPRNRGAAPSGSAGGAGRNGRRDRPSGGPGCAPPFFGFYTARTLSSNYTDIRQNPPRFCDHKCHVPFPRCQNSAEQFSERISKITSSAMVLRLWERKMPLSGKGSPVRLR